jgi:hypothetical protein
MRHKVTLPKFVDYFISSIYFPFGDFLLLLPAFLLTPSIREATRRGV